jgi:hypothetical protein
VLQTEAKQEAKKAQDYTDKAKPHAMKSRKLTEQSKEISKKNEEMVKEVNVHPCVRKGSQCVERNWVISAISSIQKGQAPGADPRALFVTRLFFKVAQKDVIRAQQAAESIKRKAMLMASKAKDQANQVSHISPCHQRLAPLREA